jgi:hypothetical protein
MNNIEIKKIKGLKPGMTDKQINDLKKGKVVVEHKPKVEPKVEVEKEKLPSIQITKEDIKNEFKLDLKKDEKDDRDFRMSSMFYSLPNKIDRTSEMSRVKDQGTFRFLCWFCYCCYEGMARANRASERGSCW